MFILEDVVTRESNKPLFELILIYVKSLNKIDFSNAAIESDSFGFEIVCDKSTNKKYINALREADLFDMSRVGEDVSSRVWPSRVTDYPEFNNPIRSVRYEKI